MDHSVRSATHDDLTTNRDRGEGGRGSAIANKNQKNTIIASLIDDCLYNETRIVTKQGVSWGEENTLNFHVTQTRLSGNTSWTFR